MEYLAQRLQVEKLNIIFPTILQNNMNIPKLLRASIAGGIVFFLLRWLIYGTVLEMYMYHNTGQAGHIITRWQIDFLYIVAGNLLRGVLFSYILLKSNTNTLASGLVTGGIIGFLMVVSTDAIIYGTTFVLSKRGMLADVIAFTLISAVAGAVIAAVIGKVENDLDQE